jgi:hypothetical protein
MCNFSLKERFPSLFSITRKKHISVASVFSTIPLNISFHRGLVGNNLTLWHNLVARVANTRFSNRDDKFIWGLHQNGIFSFKSMHLALISNNRVRLDTTIWKLKLPLRIKIFLWYLKREVVLTKDNLLMRNWWGGKIVCFAHNLNLSNIYSLSVTLLSLCGQQYILHLIFLDLILFCICLTIGQLQGA